MPKPLLWSLGVVAALVLFGVLTSQQPDLTPACSFHQLTNLQCPGCGGTRATQAALTGDFPTSLHLNPLILFLPLVPFFITALPSKLRLVTPLAALLLFGLIRNLI